MDSCTKDLLEKRRLYPSSIQAVCWDFSQYVSVLIPLIESASSERTHLHFCVKRGDLQSNCPAFFDQKACEDNKSFERYSRSCYSIYLSSNNSATSCMYIYNFFNSLQIILPLLFPSATHSATHTLRCLTGASRCYR